MTYLLATRHQVEAERQRYQERFNLAPDGYLVTDKTGTIGRFRSAMDEKELRCIGKTIEWLRLFPSQSGLDAK